MKCKGMMLNDPFLIKCDLKHIYANPTSPLHHFRRIERDDKSQTPSIVDSEISAITKVIIHHSATWHGKDFIGRSKLSNHFCQCGQAIYYEGNIVLGNGMIDAHPLPDQRPTDASIKD